MNHEMSLRRQPFDMIRDGIKTIEMRLYDEKRRSIRVGDTITFTCDDGDDPPFAVRVKALHLFDSFAELYASLPLLKCGYTAETVQNANPEDMEIYYSKERQAAYQVVGIGIERI